MRRVYLDNNATTPVAPEVFEAMRPYLVSDYGNASSIHWYGQQAKAAVENAREELARLINARPAEIVFTSGGTESDNAAIFGIVEAAKGDSKHVISSDIEHHAVLFACRALEKRGVRVTYVRAGSDGVVDPADVERAIGPDTVLITLMHANNELGTIQPLEEIGRIARQHDIFFHTDAVQSVGKIPVDVEALGVDLLSLSAHKLNGPKGVGALYVRRGTILKPLLYGGHHERDRRPGTENTPGIVGLGRAAGLAREGMPEEAARIGALRDELEAGILARVPDAGVNGSRASRIPTPPFAYHDEPALRRHRGRRVCDRYGPQGHRVFDRRGMLVRVGRSLARALGHRPHTRAGALEHSLQPRQIQRARRCCHHARDSARRGRAPARRLSALQEGRGERKVRKS